VSARQISAAVLVCGLLCGALASADDDATKWRDGAFRLSKGSFHARRYGANDEIRGGLSVSVGVSAWPQLGLYVRQWQNWLDPNVGFVVPGDIDPKQKAENIRKTEQSWTHEKYAFSSPAGSLDCWISRLTPMLLLRTDSPKLTLFRDAALTGKPTPLAWAVGLVGGQATTIGRGEALGKLSEGWVIVGFGRESNWTQQIRSSAGGSHGEYGLDWPWLVMFASKPSRVSLGDNGLVIERNGGAGYVAAMPLFGVRRIEWPESDALRKSPPADVLKTVRAFRSLLANYPVGVTDRFRFEGNTLRVRQKFTYLPVKDEWAGEARKAAPVPPLVSLAQRYGLKLAVKGNLLDLSCPTIAGPYAVIEGADELEYAAPDLLRYVWQAPRHDKTQDDPQLAARLTGEIDEMITAGHLAPVLFHAGMSYWDFYDRAELFAVLADCFDALPEEKRPALADYMAAELKTYNPFTGKAMPKGQGTRREPHAVLPEKLTGELGGGTSYTGMYHVWKYADRTGDWKMVKDNWRRILAAFQGQDLSTIDWAYLTSGGSAPELTRSLGAYIGLARLARQVGDESIRRLAEYLAVEHLIARYAYSKQAFYHHASGQDHVWVRLSRPDAPVRVTGHGSYAYPGPSEDYLYLHELFTRGAFSLPQPQTRELKRLASTVTHPALRDTRQVAMLNEMWIRLSTTADPRQHMDFHVMGFEGACPEAFRFLRERLADDMGRYLSLIEIKMPGWYLTDPWTRGAWVIHNFRDWGIEHPRFGFWMFLAKAHFGSTPARELKRYLDIPYCTGDLMWLQKALAVMRPPAGAEWRDLRESER